MRRYNKPTQLEPAVVFLGKDGKPSSNRDIAVWPRDPQTNTYRIPSTSEHIEGLAYPLLFPFGDLGWHPELEHKGRQTAVYHRVTPNQFWSFRLMIRDYEAKPDDADDVSWPHDQPSLPHSGGVLFQQWLCDVWSRTEAQRLNYFEMHQEDLRADTYENLHDALHDASYEKGQKVGKNIILPSSFGG